MLWYSLWEHLWMWIHHQLETIRVKDLRISEVLVWILKLTQKKFVMILSTHLGYLACGVGSLWFLAVHFSTDTAISAIQNPPVAPWNRFLTLLVFFELTPSGKKKPINNPSSLAADTSPYVCFLVPFSAPILRCRQYRGLLVPPGTVVWLCLCFLNLTWVGKKANQQSELSDSRYGPKCVGFKHWIRLIWLLGAIAAALRTVWHSWTC